MLEQGILAGAGILFAKAHKEFQEFIEKTGYPVVNTLLGLGTIPGDHEQFLGMGGMHGTYTSKRIRQIWPSQTSQTVIYLSILEHVLMIV